MVSEKHKSKLFQHNKKTYNFTNTTILLKEAWKILIKPIFPHNENVGKPLSQKTKHEDISCHIKISPRDERTATGGYNISQ